MAFRYFVILFIMQPHNRITARLCGSATALLSPPFQVFIGEHDEVLGGADISIAYAYSFLPKNTDNAIIILKVADADYDKAIELFSGDERTNLLARDELLTR